MPENFDLSAFEAITFSGDTIGALVGVCILYVLLPAALIFFWRKKHKTETTFRYLISGALGFLVCARVLELGVHYFCILSDNHVAHFITGNSVAYIVYGTVMAGVFEECGRYFIMKHLLKKGRTRENGVFYGIGHGCMEIILLMLPTYISYLVIASAFLKGNVSDALTALNVTEETAAVAFPAILAVSNIRAMDLVPAVFERLLTLCIHIGLSVTVLHSVKQDRPRLLGAAVLLHMAVDLLPAMYQRGIVSLGLCEGWIALWTIIIILVARRLYRADAKEETAGKGLSE